jgi:hypothetical protein
LLTLFGWEEEWGGKWIWGFVDSVWLGGMEKVDLGICFQTNYEILSTGVINEGAVQAASAEP